MLPDSKLLVKRFDILYALFEAYFLLRLKTLRTCLRNAKGWWNQDKKGSQQGAKNFDLDV